MRTNLVIRLAMAVLVFGGGSWVASTQQLPHRQMVAHKVKGDLYMLEGQGGNVAAYITSEGVILVDDMYEENHNEIIATVKSLTAQPNNSTLMPYIDYANGGTRLSGRPRSTVF